MTNGSVLQLQAPLHRPAAPGKTIKKLRGVIPLSISSRGPIRWSCRSTRRAPGSGSPTPDVEMTVHAIRSMPNAPQTPLELSVRANDRPGSVENGDSDAFGDVYRPDMHRQQTRDPRLPRPARPVVPLGHRLRHVPADPDAHQPAGHRLAQGDSATTPSPAPRSTSPSSSPDIPMP